MTRILLVRHGSCDAVGVRIAGRVMDEGLNAEGTAQCERLAARLARVPLAAVHTSPRRRTRETAAHVALPHGLEPQPCAALDEVDFGTWSGATLDALRDDEAWGRFNTFRSGTRIPGGELAIEAQLRIVAALEGFARASADGVIACVSHADMIRLAIAYFIGLPIDLAHRLAVEPASVSVLALHPWGTTLEGLNDRGEPGA